MNWGDSEDAKHYVRAKEREAQRLSFNERMAYWKKYHEDLEESE